MNPYPTDTDQRDEPPNKKPQIGAVQLLADNRQRLDSLAEAPFQAETLEGPEAYAAAGLQPSAGATASVEPATLVAS
jgi:hypothetical protein